MIEQINKRMKCRAPLIYTKHFSSSLILHDSDKYINRVMNDDLNPS